MVVYQIIQIFDLVPEHHKLIVISREVLVYLGITLISYEVLELLFVFLVLLIQLHDLHSLFFQEVRPDFLAKFVPLGPLFLVGPVELLGFVHLVTA